MDVQIFVPCFVDQLFPQVGAATVKLLRRAGCKVHYNPNQTCCGQPAFNAGFREDAKEVCEKWLRDFKQDRPIVIPSASCVGFIKNYYREIFPHPASEENLQALSNQVFELGDFLVNHLRLTNFGAQLEVNAVYHSSCASLREISLKSEPLTLLNQVAGLNLLPLPDADICCGFGGTFAVKFKDISAAMADQKITQILGTGATHIISTDSSCLMHLQGVADKKDLNLTFLHLAEVLASGW